MEVETPLHKIPLFIREGSEIDLGDLNTLYEESLKKVTQVPDLSKLEEDEGWR
jgi:alpha-glucosidase (family GH31 glycosyl hydrolase)